MNKHNFLIIGSVLFLLSCINNSESITKQNGEVSSSLSAGYQKDSEIKETLKNIDKQRDQKNLTTLEFNKLNHNFGDVISQKENKTEFIVTNTGNKPLIISNVSASCGCTMPKKPEKPIAPGKSDVIEVVFKSKPSMKNEIKKTITVTANTIEKIHKLEIRAFVK